MHFALCTKHRAIRSAIGRKTIIKIEKSIYLNVSHAIYAPGLILLICYYKVNDDTVQISYWMQFSGPNKIASQTPTMITWWVNKQWLHQQTGFSMQYLHLFDHIGAAMTQCMRCTCIIALLAQCKKHATFSDKAIHFMANYMHQHRDKKMRLCLLYVYWLSQFMNDHLQHNILCKLSCYKKKLLSVFLWNWNCRLLCIIICNFRRFSISKERNLKRK